MTVSKETAKKVRRLLKIQEEGKRIREELLAEFRGEFDGCFIQDFDIERFPSGEYQGEGEYCDQTTDYPGDVGDGVYYYPIEGSRNYLAISYNF